MYGFASGGTLKFAILYNPDQYNKPYPIHWYKKPFLVETVDSKILKDIAQLDFFSCICHYKHHTQRTDVKVVMILSESDK